MSGGGSPAVRARGLVKRYGDLVAVDGIDFEVPRGICFGLLGPNGAGKTTTIEVLEGLQEPDEGEIEVLGMRWERDQRRIRSAIGVQLQETRYPDKLTVRETLRMFRSFYDRGYEVGEALALCDLEGKADARVVDLSGGQRQRLSLGTALLSRPDVLFLDEPTTGLDPQARRRAWEVVERFKAEGGTVILTTHYMEEAETLADDVAILDRGRILARGSPAAVIATLSAESVIELRLADGAPVDEAELLGVPGVSGLRAVGSTLTLTVTEARSAFAGILDLQRAGRLPFEDLHTHRPTLEDVFVALTGKHLRDG